MKWFRNISIRGKLMLSFAVMILLMMVTIFSGFQAIVTLIQGQRSLYNQDLANRHDMTSLILEENGVRADLLTMVVADDDRTLAEAETSTRERSRRIDALIAGLRQRDTGDAAFLERFEAFDRARNAFVDTRDREIIPLVREGSRDQAAALATGVQFDRFVQMRDVLNDLAADAEAEAAAALERSTEAARSTSLLFLEIGAVVVGISILFVVVLSRAIALPISEVSSAADEIAGGNFEIRLPSDARRDEVGRLNRSFAAMADSLARVSSLAGKIADGDLRHNVEPRSERDALNKALGRMVENLRKLNAEVQEGVAVLASSASEIVASSAQVTASAAESATAVSQTMTTVEEVNQSTDLSATKASKVSEAARRAEQVSEEGRRTTDQAIDGIQKIQAQMESIADSIVRLSEQTQTIGEIIATVNDLAEQSNLLAVNAAIEAAKAGEHGQGFAVVAQEIRSLASQSKDATTQVRKIIGDIQSAMSAAVMATEQGTRAAEAGVELTSKTADVIQQLERTIGESSRMAAQIAASSQEQKAGMNQVALAIENINQASAQNVTATEQTEAAARRIEELGETLKAVVNRYQV